MARVVLAMSGGVDSSVAANLLLRDGHEVLGVFMRHGEASAAVCQTSPGDGDPTVPRSAAGELPVLGGGGQTRRDHKQGCCTASDAADARRVAAAMNIPFYALDLQTEFARIVDYFVDDYLSGRTPNPCVRCNHWIKFGKLFDYADDVGAEFVATGHYARMRSTAATEAERNRVTEPDGISESNGVAELHRGLDDHKDQSYALFGIRPDRLSRMLLPVGDYRKSEIRSMAESIGLGVANKKDSQEICFVTQGHHSEFIRAKAPERSSRTAGEFVLRDGTVVGQHDGFEAFTVGQRKGLGIALGKPAFVLKVDPTTRQVVLGDRDDLLQARLSATDANWLIDPSAMPRRVSVQIRYNGDAHPATIRIGPADPQRFDVQFDRPESSVAPGQAAVVFDGTRVLGGGWIV